MKTPVRALQPGQVIHTGAGRAAVLYVAPTAPEAPLVHLVAPPPPAPVGEERATCTLINNPPTIGARPHGNH